MCAAGVSRPMRLEKDAQSLSLPISQAAVWLRVGILVCDSQSLAEHLDVDSQTVVSRVENPNAWCLSSSDWLVS